MMPTSTTHPREESSVDAAPRVVGVVASPQGSVRTSAAVQAVLAGCEQRGATTSCLSLVDVPRGTVLAALDAADAVVFGRPTYRASYSSQLKDLLEHTERGRYGEQTAPLAGRRPPSS